MCLCDILRAFLLYAFRNHRFSISILRVQSPKPDWSCFGDNAGIVESSQASSGIYPSLERSYCSTSLAHRLSMGSRCLSSQAGAKSSGEEEAEEDAFSELEEPVSTKAFQKGDSADESEDELVSEPELSADEDVEKASQNELDLPENEMESTRKKKSRKRATSELFEAMNNAPGLSAQQVLDKWVEDGKEINREEISLAMFNLRRRRMYGKALQVNLIGHVKSQHSYSVVSSPYLFSFWSSSAHSLVFLSANIWLLEENCLLRYL